MTSENDIEASAAILEAAGYELVPLRHPLAGVWHLLAADPFHMLLVSVIRGPEWPDFGGANPYRHPPTWPPWRPGGSSTRSCRARRWNTVSAARATVSIAGISAVLLHCAMSAAGDTDFTCGYPNNTTTAACRWGDYSGASPDPLNANVVWGSNQALTTPPVFPASPTDPAWVTQNFAIAGPIVTRTAPIQSSPVPTPTRGPAAPGAPPGPPGTR